MNLSYKKAWKSKEVVLKSLMDSDEKSYDMFPSFSYMLDNYNPSSIVSLETEKDDRFFCSFFCLTVFIYDWPHCRPVLIGDRTLLKEKYCGTLLTECAMDANEKKNSISICSC